MSFFFLLADVRLEEFVYEKLEKKAPTRMSNHELLGQSLIDAGSELGPGTAYGEYDAEFTWSAFNVSHGSFIQLDPRDACPQNETDVHLKAQLQSES